MLSGSGLPIATFDQLDASADGMSAQVVARELFYNNSAFDGEDSSANAGDDAAIASDKQALLPGQAASFANYSSYSRGVNGVVIDLLDMAGSASAGDFALHVGNTDQPDDWTRYAGPFTVDTRPGVGVDGSDRVTLILPDGAIVGNWLQVTVLSDLAGGMLGLSQNDVFYFGNAPGESGDNPTNTTVDATDELGARNHQHNFLNPAAIDDVYDYNRDARVDATDELLARNSQTNFLTRLKLFVAPEFEPYWPTGDQVSSTFEAYLPAAPYEQLDVFSYQDMDWVRVPWNGPTMLQIDRLDGQSATEHRVRPERLDISSTAAGSTISVSLDSPQNLVLSVGKLRKLVILPQVADPNRPDLANESVVNVQSLGADPSGTFDNTDILQNAIDQLPVGGTLYFPSGRYISGSLDLKSDMTLYLDDGALLKGSDDPYQHDFRLNTLYFVRAENATNVKIRGYGTIDANGQVIRSAWQQIKGVDKVAGRALLAVNADDMDIENITVRESYSWNTHFVECDRLHINNVKVFSNMSQGNGDGIDLDGCRDVLVENSLIIAEDDAISPKAAWTDRSPMDYVIRDSVLWSQNATGIRLGAETHSATFENMLFENIDILRANTMMRIYNYDGADMHGITFRNIWVEEYSYYVQNLGYDEISLGDPVVSGETFFFFAYVRQRNDSSPIGLIHDVVMENVHSPRVVESRVDGLVPAGGGYSVYDVSFHNYWIGDECLVSLSQLNISVRNAAEPPTVTCD
jgi:hypothetical protein